MVLCSVVTDRRREEWCERAAAEGASPQASGLVLAERAAKPTNVLTAVQKVTAIDVAVGRLASVEVAAVIVRVMADH